MRRFWHSLYWYVLIKLYNLFSNRLIYVLNTNNELRHLFLTVPWKEKIEHGDEDDTLRAIQESIWGANPYVKKAFWDITTSTRIKPIIYDIYVEFSSNLIAEEQIQSGANKSQLLEIVQKEWIKNATGNQHLYRFVAYLSISLFIVLSGIFVYGLLKKNGMILNYIGGLGDLVTLLFWLIYKPWNKLEESHNKLIKIGANFDNYRHRTQACLEIVDTVKRIKCLKEAIRDLQCNLPDL